MAIRASTAARALASSIRIFTRTSSFAAVNGIRIAYETHGDNANPAITLVNGTSETLAAWPQPIIDDLAAAGFFVVTCDNRDMGLSTSFADKCPNAVELQQGLNTGQVSLEEYAAAAPYSLSEITNDITGLWDTLHIEQSHVLGYSKGGEIIWNLALETPSRILSMTHLETAPNTWTAGRETMMADNMEYMMTVIGAMQIPDPKESKIKCMELCAGTSPVSEEDRDVVRAAIDKDLARGVVMDFCAFALQDMASAALQGKYEHRFNEINTPTLIIHGEEDKLLKITLGGELSARAVSRARFVRVPEMGHALTLGPYRSVWRDELITFLKALHD